jgi:hypothetical protein
MAEGGEGVLLSHPSPGKRRRMGHPAVQTPHFLPEGEAENSPGQRPPWRTQSWGTVPTGKARPVGAERYPIRPSSPFMQLPWDIQPPASLPPELSYSQGPRGADVAVPRVRQETVLSGAHVLFLALQLCFLDQGAPKSHRASVAGAARGVHGRDCARERDEGARGWWDG